MKISNFDSVMGAFERQGEDMLDQPEVMAICVPGCLEKELKVSAGNQQFFPRVA